MNVAQELICNPTKNKTKIKQVRVADVDGPEEADCSDEFYLMASAEAPVVGAPDAPYLFVTSPSTGDMARAGGEYTVEVSFFFEDFYGAACMVAEEAARLAFGCA